MRESDKKPSGPGGKTNPEKARGSRVPPVIELSASEVASEAVVKETAEAAHAETATPKPDTTKPEDETPTPTAGVHAADQTLPAPENKRSLAGPMAVAAILGGVLGTLGGSVLPGILGFSAPGPAADIQKLRQQVTALETKPASSEIDSLRQKVQSLEAELARKVAETETRLANRISGTENGVKELAARPVATAAGGVGASVDLVPLTQRLGALERDLKTLDGKTEANTKAPDPRMTAMAQQVEQATRRMNAANAAPFFSAVQGLSQAFMSGQPFSTELTAVELLGGQAEQLVPLRDLAAKGAPTLQQLAAGFAPLAGKLVQSDDKSDSWGWSLVQRFAKVRPAGQVGGSTPADLVATIEASLARGDLASALSALKRLPEPNRGPAQEWARVAETRDKAAKAVAAIQDSAISALRTAKP